MNAPQRGSLLAALILAPGLAFAQTLTAPPAHLHAAIYTLRDAAGGLASPPMRGSAGCGTDHRRLVLTAAILTFIKQPLQGNPPDDIFILLGTSPASSE